MIRIVSSKYAELILASFDRLPPGMARRLENTHFFTGTSPIYAGLFDYEKTTDGRSYHTEWCVAYSHHLKKLSRKYRETTIIMPEHSPGGYPMALLPMILIHELGHVLDEILGFCHIALPVTKYAGVNREEAFAEAFTSWLNPGYGQFYKQSHSVDEKTLGLFRELEEVWGIAV